MRPLALACAAVALVACACAADTALLDTPTGADAATTPILDSGTPRDAGARDAAVLTSSVVIVDEPSLYQFYRVVDGHTVHMPTALTGCEYPFPFPARVQNVGHTPLDGTLTVEGSTAFEVRGGALHLEPGQAAAFTVVARGDAVPRADGVLVARYRDGDHEVTARRDLTVAIEEGPQVESYSVAQIPWINVLYVVDGSTLTERHRDRIVRSVEQTFAESFSAGRVRWAVAYGAPGHPTVVDQGGVELIGILSAPDLLLGRIDVALTSTRTGDPIGAALQALRRLEGLDSERWVVLFLSASDGPPSDIAELDQRTVHADFQVGGSLACDAPETPNLVAAADALGVGHRAICEPPGLFAETPGPVPGYYYLRYVPDPESIRVEVDGADVSRHAADGSETWAWDQSRNAVRFSGPAERVYGRTVTVRYLRPCADVSRFQRR